MSFEQVPVRNVVALGGRSLRLPHEQGVTHLQFRRFAGCPICNLHLHSFVSGKAELERAGICEVVVFYSAERDVERYAGELPFFLVADPERKLYDEFGVGKSLLGLTQPRAIGAALRGMFTPLPINLSMQDDMRGLPADFLVAPDGRVLGAHYGQHAHDQWSLPEVLALAKGASQ